MATFKLPILSLIPAALAFLAASPARANCARPVTYEATVTGNTVQVEPVNFDSRACPDASGMLRQTVGAGDIVKLADFCADGDELSAYVDECVPAGTYRYGFSAPYTCSTASCNTDYFVEATVTDTLDPSCVRSAGNAGPSAANAVPWQGEAVICSYNENGGGGTGGTGTVTGTDTTSTTTPSVTDSTSSTSSTGSGGANSFFEGGNDNPSGSSGCTVALGSGAAPVIGANAVALLAGLGLMRRRHARKP